MSTLKEISGQAHKKLLDLVEEKWKGRDALRTKQWEEQKAFYRPYIKPEEKLEKIYYSARLAYINSNEYAQGEYLNDLKKYKKEISGIDVLVRRLKKFKPRETITIGDSKCWMSSSASYAIKEFLNLKKIYLKNPSKYTLKDIEFLCHSNNRVVRSNKNKIYRGNWQDNPETRGRYRN